MRALLPLALSLLSLAAATAPALRAEDAKEAVDVPKAAAEAVQKKYPDGVVAKWSREEEDGKVEYEAKVVVKTKEGDKETVRGIEVSVSPEGKILEEEEVIDPALLPEAVRKAIAASPHAKAKIVRAQRQVVEEKADAARYEVLFEENGKRSEVTFDAAGKVLEEEGGDEEDHGGAGMEGGGGMGGGGGMEGGGGMGGAGGGMGG